jgi:chorismate-pyruvate lyase
VLPTVRCRLKISAMRQHIRRLALGIALFIAPAAVDLAAPADRPQEAAPEFPWHDTLLARLEALSLLQTLNADLLSHESATVTLERWCQAHHMSSPARVVAESVGAIDKPPTAQQREQLGVTATEVVRYRRVRLHCGDHVLSEAENWYVPGRLTPEMNRLLESSRIPFGRVVQPLHFSRHVLEATLLWSPLPAGWEEHGNAAAMRTAAWPNPRSAVLQHRALLVLPDGHPISEVIETYTAAVLAFPEPQLER